MPGPAYAKQIKENRTLPGAPKVNHGRRKPLQEAARQSMPGAPVARKGPLPRKRKDNERMGEVYKLEVGKRLQPAGNKGAPKAVGTRKGSLNVIGAAGLRTGWDVRGPQEDEAERPRDPGRPEGADSDLVVMGAERSEEELERDPDLPPCTVPLAGHPNGEAWCQEEVAYWQRAGFLPVAVSRLVGVELAAVKRFWNREEGVR